MSQDFYYVDLDRREYFRAGLGSEPSSPRGIGRGFAARALGLLLRDDGAWARDRIVAIPDTSPEYETEIRGHYRPIDSSVLLLLFADDRDKLMHAATAHDPLFVHLAELAIAHGAADVGHALQDAFGSDWKKRYGELRKTSPWIIVPPP